MSSKILVILSSHFQSCKLGQNLIFVFGIYSGTQNASSWGSLFNIVKDMFFSYALLTVN